MKGNQKTKEPDMIEIFNNPDNEYVNSIVTQMFEDGYTVKTVTYGRHEYKSDATLVVVFTKMED